METEIVNKELTPSESAELERLEAIIERTQGSAVEFYVAVEHVKSKELWRSKYKSFDEYCEKRWNWTRRRGDQIAKAGAILLAIPEKVRTIVLNEGQFREVSKIPEGKREEVLEAAAAAGPVTAKSIKEAAERIVPKPATAQPSQPPTSTPPTPATPHPAPKPAKPDIELDTHGTQIKQNSIQYWNRRQEVQDHLTAIIRIKSAMKKAKDSSDTMYARISNTIISELDHLHSTLSETLPYAVCTDCEGAPEVKVGGCYSCRGTGLICKFHWDNKSREEVKTIRLKEIAEKAKKK